MKSKITTGLMLAAIVAVGAWLWRHPRVKLVEKPVVKSEITAAKRTVPVNALKMVAIAGGPHIGSTNFSPTTSSDWLAIQKIVDGYASFVEREKAIHSLSGHLNEKDWEELQQFLLKPDGVDASQRGQVLKNELLDVLCALNPPPASLGDTLIQMYQDRQQNEVIRDYAVQHMTAYYEQLSDAADMGEARQNIQAALWQAVGETSDSIGGTALLALKRLSLEYPEFDQGKLATTAMQLAGDVRAGELTHITTFQVCAQLGTVDALPVVLQAAQNGETISVKMSAIGALGRLGGTEQISFLNEILTGSDDRLKPAAGHALEQINARQSQLASKN